MGLTGEHGEEAVGADVYLGIGRAVEIEVKTYRDGSADVVVTEKQNRTCPRDVLKAVRRSTGCVAVRVHVPETVGPARRERLHRSRRSRRGSCHQIPYAGGRGFVAQVLSFPIAARIRRFAAIRLVQLWVVDPGSVGPPVAGGSCAAPVATTTSRRLTAVAMARKGIERRCCEDFILTSYGS